MDIFEKESGLFDLSGNVNHGHELYYYYLGSYLLGENKLDSASYWFRNLLDYGYNEAAY